MSFFLIFAITAITKRVNDWLTESCCAKFSDSKVIAVIAKRVWAEKNAPKYSDFGLNAVISRIAHSYFSDCTLLFLAKVRIICSSTATHPQHYCG